MQTSLNKSKKLTRDTRNKYKANRTGFPILSIFSNYIFNKQGFRQRARKHIKTLLNSKDARQQVAPMER